MTEEENKFKDSIGVFPKLSKKTGNKFWSLNIDGVWYNMMTNKYYEVDGNRPEFIIIKSEPNPAS